METEVKLDAIDLVMNALKDVELIPEDCNDWDVVYEFRNYICRVSFFSGGDVHINYEKVLDIIEPCSGDYYDRANISIVGIPIEEHKRARTDLF